MNGFVKRFIKLLGVLSLLLNSGASSAVLNPTTEITDTLGNSTTKSLNDSNGNGIQGEGSSKEEIGRLLDILNTTSLRVSELVSPQNETLKSRIGPKEFISLIKLIEGVRKFVDDQSTRVSSQDGSQTDSFSSSLKDIQKFFTEHEQKLGAAMQQASSASDSSSSSSSDGQGGSSGDDSYINGGAGSVSGGRPTQYPVLGGSRNSAGGNGTSGSQREGRGGLITNFMKISSDMSRGVGERVRQAGSLFQDSVNQVQNQISRFMNGVGGLIRRVSGQTGSLLQQNPPEVVFQ